MTIELAGIVALLVGVLFLTRGPGFGINVFVPSTLLGSCAAFTIPAIGATTIQPAHLLLGFLAISAFIRPAITSRALHAVAFPSPGFWLLATTVYGAFSAYFCPRIFAGATYVAAIGTTNYGLSMMQVPLGPTSGNITQTLYFIGDVVCFIVTLLIASSKSGLRLVANAMIVYCGLNIVFAALDLTAFWTGTEFLLDPIRNSTYVLHLETVVYGFKRIVGSFTEASAFAYATLGAFAFTARLWLGGVKPALNFSIAMISLVLLAFSTSSTAYAATPVIILYIYLTTGVRFVRETVPTQVLAFLIVAPIALTLLFVVIQLLPGVNETVRSMLDVMLFDKSSSDSAHDRGTWNEAAMAAFYATQGLGAGVGSVRASSFPIAVLANIGVAGGLTYGAFLYHTLFSRGPQRIDWFAGEVRAAARAACVAFLVAATVSGALIDLGLTFFVAAGLACGANEVESGAFAAARSRAFFRTRALDAKPVSLANSES